MFINNKLVIAAGRDDLAENYRNSVVSQFDGVAALVSIASSGGVKQSHLKNMSFPGVTHPYLNPDYTPRSQFESNWIL